MPRRLSIQEHLSVDELEKNYRITYDPIERTWYQIIWLKRKRKNNTLIVFSVTGYCLEAIRKIARRYNQQGKEVLLDRCHQHPGPKGFLCDERQAQLEMAFQEKVPDGGLGHGRKVGDWLTEIFWLSSWSAQGMGIFTLNDRIPGPELHFSATPAEEQEWKKTLLPIWKIKSWISRDHCRTLSNGWTSFGSQVNFPTSMDTCWSTSNCRD